MIYLTSLNHDLSVRDSKPWPPNLQIGYYQLCYLSRRVREWFVERINVIVLNLYFAFNATWVYLKSLIDKHVHTH